MAWRLAAAIVACCFGGLAGADDHAQGGRETGRLVDDARLLQGTWHWDPAAKQSDAEPRILLDRVVVRGETLTFYYRHQDKVSATTTRFRLDPEASPKRIDFVPTEGATKGQAYSGLYEFRGGRLRICYRGPGATRPKDFADERDPKSNDGTAFITLRPSPR